MTVLVLRPSPSGEALVDLLNQHGIRCWHTPLMQFVEGQELDRLPDKLSHMRAGDLLLVVSQHAVGYANRILAANNMRWPAHVHYFAIGQTTANALRLVTDRQVYYPKDREISEHLLQLPQLHNIKGKNALILRGNGGRELLAERLQLRGATVNFCECYQRQPICYPNAELLAVWQAQQISAIVVTSAGILQRIYALMEEQNGYWLSACQLIVVSERIALLAKQLGWNNVKIANNADNRSLLAALK